MAESGDQLSLAAIHGVKVDKHSTGGVGDKTTFIVAPILASLGVPVAKMSGRGLGHTGGTIDKLEAIPGFCVSIPETEFIEHVNSMKLALVGQTGDLAPEDLCAARCDGDSRQSAAHCIFDYEQEACGRCGCNRAGCEMWQRRIYEERNRCKGVGTDHG